jgi:hypothetical protein
MAKYLSPALYQQIEKKYQNNNFFIDLKLWTYLVYDLLAVFAQRRNKTSIKMLKWFYFGRVATFFKQIEKWSPQQTEREVRKMAQFFWEKRNYLLKKIN